MCGFAGFIDLDGTTMPARVRSEVLSAMGQMLARRGPDDEQIYDDGNLSFIFRRLSIIDVSGGQQPMWNEDNTIFAAVNGEIYNHEEIRRSLSHTHQFRTRSDSECVLHLYEELGAECLEKLNGMFAVVIWDTRRRRLFLARDRLGIKPLYYSLIGDTLLFGSELKALLAHPDCPRDFDWESLYSTGPQQNPEVPAYIKNVHHIPGGHFLIHEPGSHPAPRAYWSIDRFFPAPDDASPTAGDDFTQRYTALLADSVSMRLMSDVPVGCFLSGGIDSSLITALAADRHPGIHSFTFVDQTTFNAGDVEMAMKLASNLDICHYPVLFDLDSLLDELQFDLSAFEYFIWVMDSPRFDLEWLFKHELHRYAKTALPDLKVILLGQGADEFAGGYTTRLDRKHDGWSAYLHDDLHPGLVEHERIRQHVPGRFARLLSRSFPRSAGPDGVSEYHLLMQDYVYQLQHFNLWHEDRISASQGVEARVPFLDHRIVELLASIPARLHPDLFWDKKIVRDALHRRIPAYPRDKPKVSFFITREPERIQAFSIELLRRIFPAFREKYLELPDPVFSRKKLVSLYDSINGVSPASGNTAWLLFECMAVSVFHEICRGSATHGYASIRLDPPSPLRSAVQQDLDKFCQTGSDHRGKEVNIDKNPDPFQPFRLIPGIRFLLPNTPAGSKQNYCILKHNRQIGELQYNSGNIWVRDLFRELEHREQPITLMECSRLLDIAPEKIGRIIVGMLRAGLIEYSSEEQDQVPDHPRASKPV